MSMSSFLYSRSSLAFLIRKLGVMSSEGLARFSAEWLEKDCRECWTGKAQAWWALLLPGIAGSPEDQVTTSCRVIFNRSEIPSLALTSSASVAPPAAGCAWCVHHQQQGGKDCAPSLCDLYCWSTVLEAEAGVGKTMKSLSNMQMYFDVCSNCATTYFSISFLLFWECTPLLNHIM